MIEIVEHTPAKFVAADGQEWGSEFEGQNYNAELAAMKIVGELALNKSYNRSTIGNLAKLPLADLKVLRTLLDEHLVERQPVVQLTEKIGHLPGGKIRTLKTDDGREHYSKDDAIKHLLELRFIAAIKDNQLSQRALIAFTRGSVTVSTTRMPDAYEMRSTFNNLFDVRYADDTRKDMVPIIRDAIDAMIEVRSAPMTPVRPQGTTTSRPLIPAK